MAQTQSISISATPRTKISLDLVGHKYVVTPPKSAVAMQMARTIQEDGGTGADIAWRELMGWVSQAFNNRDAAAIEKRLRDPKDDLDIEHIMQLVQAVTEAASGNPTT